VRYLLLQEVHHSTGHFAYAAVLGWRHVGGLSLLRLKTRFCTKSLLEVGYAKHWSLVLYCLCAWTEKRVSSVKHPSIPRMPKDLLRPEFQKAGGLSTTPDVLVTPQPTF
jgi:hypothetical protein